MSLSAKQCILKLRETEYKIQKLQTDLLNGEIAAADPATTSEFLAHHKELMSLPIQTKDTISYRFGARKRYYELKQPQKLTIAPRSMTKSIGNILQAYQNDFAEDSQRRNDALRKYRSPALELLYSKLDEETSKMAVRFSKASTTTSAKSRSGLQARSSRSIKGKSSRPLAAAGGPGSVKSKIQSKPPSGANIMFKHVSKENPSTDAISKRESQENSKMAVDLGETGNQTSRASQASLYADDNDRLNDNLPPTPSWDNLETNSEDLRKSVAIALRSSNLMGVFLPSDSKTKKRGPGGWIDKVSSKSKEDEEQLTPKEAINLLRRRQPIQSTPTYRTTQLPPHQRGLIGVEITSFEPECAFFYRDRRGNYNPHLHHTKNVSDNIKNKRDSRLHKPTTGH